MSINLRYPIPQTKTETELALSAPKKSTPTPSREAAAPENPIGEITKLLSAFRNGRPEAASGLFVRTREILRNIAYRKLVRERRVHSLGPSDLVQEASIKIFPSDLAKCRDTAHFLCVMTRAMRQILIDHARKWLTQKRGCGAEQVALEENRLPMMERPTLFLALDARLDELARIDPRMAQIVELRFFAGFTIGETAELLQICPSTVKSQWLHARAWLHGHLEHELR